jgi:hypothetical protein
MVVFSPKVSPRTISAKSVPTAAGTHAQGMERRIGLGSTDEKRLAARGESGKRSRVDGGYSFGAILRTLAVWRTAE